MDFHPFLLLDQHEKSRSGETEGRRIFKVIDIFAVRIVMFAFAGSSSLYRCMVTGLVWVSCASLYWNMSGKWDESGCTRTSIGNMIKRFLKDFYDKFTLNGNLNRDCGLDFWWSHFHMVGTLSYSLNFLIPSHAKWGGS